MTENDAQHPAQPKLDRRIVRTRKAINTALDKLLSENDVSKITVSAIAREADIDRKTFYLHYPSIDSLLTHRAEEIIEHVIDIIRGHSEETRKQRIHGILADINKSIVENLGFYEHTAHSLPVNAMIDLMGRSAKPAFAATGVDTHLMDDVEFRMRMNFYLSGALMLYRSWVLSDHSTPIERISELLEETLDTDSFPALNLKSNSEN